jgi:microcystin-dependent protein
MPRNPQGLYTPPLPPVRAGELIESVWANTTVDDIASALTGSLPRNGSAPMLAPLTLSNIPPTQPRHAIDKGYLDQFIAYATGMPTGAVIPLAGSVVPAGYLLCDGQAVSRTTYATLFAAIGTIYGSGDGANTFNVPDMRDWFVRGKGDNRLVGSTQLGAFAAHVHPVNDPGHAHVQLAHDHTLTTQTHSHGVNDPGHVHQIQGGDLTIGPNWAVHPSQALAGPVNTSSNGTGISIQSAGALSGTTDQRAPTIGTSQTGLVVGTTGDTETRPQNVAMNYVIKAVDDSGSLSGITEITSSNTSVISINTVNPVIPELVIHANVGFGLAQLDQNAKISPAQLPAGIQSFLGTFDASGGNNPSQEFPATTFNDGDTYLLSAGGTITVFDPNTNTQALTVVDLGWNLVYLQNSTQPVGWYYLEAPVVTAAIASQVAFTPSGTIGATDVQAAIEELDTETQAGLAALNAAKAAVGNAAPTMNGVADPGASTAASRQDHVHPSDTSRAPASAATAAGTAFTPGGNISAVNVQNALVELDNEKAALTGAAFTGPVASTSNAEFATTAGSGFGVRVRRGPSGSAVIQFTDDPVTAEIASISADDTGGLLYKAVAGRALIQGNNAGYPVVFRDGGGNDIAGVANGTGAWTPFSDRRLKNDIEPIQYGLSTILALRPVQYEMRGTRAVGFIAQEVETIVPESVMAPMNEDEFYGMDKTSIIPILVKAVQELTARIAELEAK